MWYRSVWYGRFLSMAHSVSILQSRPIVRGRIDASINLPANRCSNKTSRRAKMCRRPHRSTLKFVISQMLLVNLSLCCRVQGKRLHGCWPLLVRTVQRTHINMHWDWGWMECLVHVWERRGSCEFRLVAASSVAADNQLPAGPREFTVWFGDN